jgi:streptogramin lyase
MVKDFAFLFLFPLFVFCAARPVPTDVRVTIREYDMPTPNSRPHDPAVAPDGALWYTDSQQINWAGWIRSLVRSRNIR